jgi:multidrug efflux pump subunit AcrA (membrane-fusion protein)
MNKMERLPTPDVPFHSPELPSAPDPEIAAPKKRRGAGGRILGGAVALLLFGALALGFWQHYSLHAQVTATAEGRKEYIPSVRTAPVRASASTMAVSWPATTEAFAQANIYARASGYISRRDVDIGSHVKAGQLLVEITAPELDHQIAQAEATLAQMQATLQQAKANRDLAKVTWDRDSPLVQKGWVTPQQGDTDRLTLAAREAAVAIAEANIKAQEAQLKVLRQQKAYQSVVAPFEGVITQRNIDVGSLVQADATSGTFLFTFMHSETIRIAGRSSRPCSRRGGGRARARDAGSQLFRDGDAHRRRAAAKHTNALDRDRCAQSRSRFVAGNLLHRRTEDTAQDAFTDRSIRGYRLQPGGPERRGGRGRNRAHPDDQCGARLRHNRRGECRCQRRRSGDPQSPGRSYRRA